MDFDKPTVRDAVSVGLVKLDDGSVSNSKEYVGEDEQKNTNLEWERRILNQNYRINLFQDHPEYSNVHYMNSEDPTVTIRKKVEEQVYQGVRLSNSMLNFFDDVFDLCFDKDNEQ